MVYRVIDGNGATITGYDNVPAPPGTTDDVVYYMAESGGEPVRLAAMRRLFVERAFVGEVAVVVGHTMRARSALARDIARNALFIVAAAGVALVALVVFAVRLSLSPLRRIEGALLARDPNDLSPLEVAAPREVETMVAAIDRFMARLSRRVTVMQNLIADATHQLKTRSRRYAPRPSLRATRTNRSGFVQSRRGYIIARWALAG